MPRNVHPAYVEAVDVCLMYRRAAIHLHLMGASPSVSAAIRHAIDEILSNLGTVAAFTVCEMPFACVRKNETLPWRCA